jgi:hypothetical protein
MPLAVIQAGFGTLLPLVASVTVGVLHVGPPAVPVVVVPEPPWGQQWQA